MRSKDWRQLELVPTLEPHREELTPAFIRMIRKRKTIGDAWNFAQQVSALEDKEIYSRLPMDASHWTKLGKGQAFPPSDERFTRYFDIVQNEIPLIWLAEYRGYDWTTIRKHTSDQDKRIEALEQENRDLKRMFRLQSEFTSGK